MGSRKRNREVVLPRETPEERAQLIEGGINAPRASQIIRESTHVRLDGTVRQAAGVVDVAASGSTEEAPAPLLRPDVRREEPEPEPVYDVLEEEEGGRALRDSVCCGSEAPCSMLTLSERMIHFDNGRKTIWRFSSMNCSA